MSALSSAAFYISDGPDDRVLALTQAHGVVRREPISKPCGLDMRDTEVESIHHASRYNGTTTNVEKLFLTLMKKNFLLNSMTSALVELVIEVAPFKSSSQLPMHTCKKVSQREKYMRVILSESEKPFVESASSKLFLATLQSEDAFYRKREIENSILTHCRKWPYEDRKKQGVIMLGESVERQNRSKTAMYV